MDCHSDFFSLLSLAQVNNSATATSVAPAASFSAQPAIGSIAPSLNQLGALSYNSNGHRLRNGEVMASAPYSLGLLGGPILVPAQCSVNNDIDMADGGSMSLDEGLSCRQFSGVKRKRGNAAAALAVGDDAEMNGSAEWAAALSNGHNLQVDLDLQPDKQKRMCSESHHNVFYSHHHHHPFTSLDLPSHNHHHLSHNIHDSAQQQPIAISIDQPHPPHPVQNGINHSTRNTFANQKLNLCMAGRSVLEEEAGSCMHVHVPGVSVTECPRCLAGEPVYAINTGTYGTLESIFEHSHANNGHQLMTIDTDNCMT